MIVTFHVDVDSPTGRTSEAFADITKARLAFNRVVATFRREGLEVDPYPTRALILKDGRIHATVDFRTRAL